jgi:glutamate dehydrogenase/leucine dehydrogenase
MFDQWTDIIVPCALERQLNCFAWQQSRCELFDSVAAVGANVDWI